MNLVQKQELIKKITLEKLLKFEAFTNPPEEKK